MVWLRCPSSVVSGGQFLHFRDCSYPRGMPGSVSRTDSSGLDHVADGESLDRLVLGSATSAVGAAHGLDVAAALLVATAVKVNMSVPV